MIMLSTLLNNMLPKTRLIIYGYDTDQRKNWCVFNGYQFQVILGALIEDCEVISITNELSTGAVILVVDAHYDNYVRYR